jgi:TniQ
MKSPSANEGTCSFVPKQLPFCPRPLSSELLTSWLERVAVANLLSASQLLDSLLRRCPELDKICPCLDYDLPACWAKALGAFCRIEPYRLRALDLRRQFKDQPLEWFVQDSDGHGDFEVGARPRILHPFCVACLRRQALARFPLHLPAHWTLAFLTHCPEHGCPLFHRCPACFTSTALPFGPVGDQIDLVNCRRCRIALPVLGTQNARFLGNQRVALALEKNIWASFQGQAPDPSWAGPLSGAEFFELIRQLIELLSSRETDGGSILAERLNSFGFPGHYSTGAEQPSIALGMLGWLERRQLMRVLAMVLLGPGSPEFFPSGAFIEPAQQTMFPFQILLRALPSEVEAKLWKLVPRWPEGLQARVFAAAAWKPRQNHPFATGKRSSRVHRLTAPNSTN